MKRALAIAAASGMLVVAAPAAHAGEITGGGDLVTPIKVLRVAASECSFSGLDDLTEQGAPSWDTRPRVTQSFGQGARYAKGDLGGFNPSFACSPGKPLGPTAG